MENALVEIGRILTMYLTLPIIAITLLLLLGMCNKDKVRQQGRTIRRRVPPKGKRPTLGSKKKSEDSGGEDELQE